MYRWKKMDKEFHKKNHLESYAAAISSDIDKKFENKMCSVAADVENMNKAVQSARSLAAEELDKESRRCNIIASRRVLQIMLKKELCMIRDTVCNY